MKKYPASFTWLMGAATLACGLLCGCSGSDVATVPVHGTITLAGKPLPGGLVSFLPVKLAAGLPNRPPQGAVQADGQYSLSSFHPDDGAVPGEYVVTVQGPQIPETVDRFSKAPAAPVGPKIPSIYTNAGSTPLKAIIPEGGPPQQIDYDLKEK